MIRASLLIVFLLSILITTSEATEETPDPSIHDLEFMVGKWAITFEIYDTRNPERGMLFRESGTQECALDLPHNGEPQFITCVGEVAAYRNGESEPARHRTFRESISYNRFIGAYERIGRFSNWPSTAQETAFWHPSERVLELRGTLEVEDGMLERYDDRLTFNEDFSAFHRRNVANFSDMPLTEYQLTLAGTGKRID